MNKDSRILEAILFASNDPVKESELMEKIQEKSKLNDFLVNLQNFYKERGINLKKVGNKWSFHTSSDLSEDLNIFKQQKRKISRAAIETLAIIAYNQPITRSEIENIRGVQMGRGSIDHLLEIGWIVPKGRKKIPGKPTLWHTTDLFLEQFNIENLDSLPNKEELKSSGFLDKRLAIASISDLSDNKLFDETNNEDDKEENLDDFISSN